MSRRNLFLALVGWLALLCPAWPQATENPREQDVLLTSQLREAFRNVDGLQGVTLEVRGGVAVLRGTVTSLEASLEASRVASKVEGVIAVDNEISIESDVRERLSPALTKLYKKGATLVSFIPLLGVAVAVFLIFAGSGKLFARWDWFFARFSRSVFVRDLLKQIVSFGFLVVGGVLALELLEATALVGALLGTAGLLGVVVGFAFRDLAENSLASVLLSLRQPFSPNDHVVIDGHEGKVVRLTSRATILLTLDGNHLRIPNAAVFKSIILNYTKNPERRFSFSVGVDTGESLARAQALAVATLLEAPGVIARPAPACRIEALGDSTVNLLVLGWVDQRSSDFLKVRSEAIRHVKEAFDAAGISMPEPIYKVRLEKTQGADPVRPLPTPQEEPVDVAPETHLERRIDEERETDEGDLLEGDGTLE